MPLRAEPAGDAIKPGARVVAAIAARQSAFIEQYRIFKPVLALGTKPGVEQQRAMVGIGCEQRLELPAGPRLIGLGEAYRILETCGILALQPFPAFHDPHILAAVLGREIIPHADREFVDHLLHHGVG